MTVVHTLPQTRAWAATTWLSQSLKCWNTGKGEFYFPLLTSSYVCLVSHHVHSRYFLLPMRPVHDDTRAKYCLPWYLSCHPRSQQLTFPIENCPPCWLEGTRRHEADQWSPWHRMAYLKVYSRCRWRRCYHHRLQSFPQASIGDRGVEIWCRLFEYTRLCWSLQGFTQPL